MNFPARKADPDTELLSRAEAASHGAYCPYSKFAVGAAVRTRSGAIYTGCNVENISYSITTCAERNALAAAIVAEGPRAEIARIAIFARNDTTHAPCPPCGACRQAIAENAPAAEVIFYGPGLQLERKTPADLLPGAFAFESKCD